MGHSRIDIDMGGALRKGNFTDNQSQLFLEVFIFFDQDNNGYIELDELFNVFGNLGVEVTKEELKEKIDEVDIERNGKVSFSEFVALMRETITDIHDEKRLKEAFTIFDSDGDGEIDIDLCMRTRKDFETLENGELDKMMKKLGQELEIDQIKEMIKTADLDRDGKISWDEFKKFMQSPN